MQLILDSHPQPLVVAQQVGYWVPYQLQTPQPNAPPALDRELERELERELDIELDRELERELETELERELDIELERELERELDMELDSELELDELREAANAAISLSDNALPTKRTSSRLPANKGSGAN